jgi:hypothetical protein
MYMVEEFKGVVVLQNGLERSGERYFSGCKYVIGR